MEDMRLNRENIVIKVAASLALSAALLGAAVNTGNAQPEQVANAAGRVKIELKRNSYIYNRYGHRRTRAVIFKHNRLYSYGGEDY